MSWHPSLSRNHIFDLIYLVSRDVADLSVHHLDLIVHGAPCLLTSADALQVSRSCRHALVVLCSRTVRRVSGPVPGGHAALRLYSSLY